MPLQPCASLQLTMFNFWRAKADSAEEQITPTAESTPPPPPQQEEQPSPAAAEAKVVVVEVIEEAPVAVELVEAPAEPTPAAAPEPEPEAPPKMPHKPTAEELDAAKEELVQEIVNKVLEIDGAVVEQINTAPYDPRFPSTNQNRHCFIRYNEYYKCAFERGADDPRCQFYKNAYGSLCPPDWIEEWEELRSQGLWFGKY